MARIDGLRRSDNPRYFMFGYDLYPLLEDRGLFRKGKVDPLGGSCGINGVRIVVVPKGPVETYRYNGRPVKSSKHRVFAECDCGRLIPFGRLGQHRKSCTANAYADGWVSID